MIDRQKLNGLLTDIQITILERIKVLSQTADLLDDIKLVSDTETDEYLMFLIQNEAKIRKNFCTIGMEFANREEELWNKLLSIDQGLTVKDRG